MASSLVLLHISIPVREYVANSIFHRLFFAIFDKACDLCENLTEKVNGNEFEIVKKIFRTLELLFVNTEFWTF